MPNSVEKISQIISPRVIQAEACLSLTKGLGIESTKVPKPKKKKLTEYRKN